MQDKILNHISIKPIFQATKGVSYREGDILTSNGKLGDFGDDSLTVTWNGIDLSVGDVYGSEPPHDDKVYASLVKDLDKILGEKSVLLSFENIGGRRTPQPLLGYYKSKFIDLHTMEPIEISPSTISRYLDVLDIEGNFIKGKDLSYYTSLTPIEATQEDLDRVTANLELVKQSIGDSEEELIELVGYGELSDYVALPSKDLYSLSSIELVIRYDSVTDHSEDDFPFTYFDDKHIKFNGISPTWNSPKYRAKKYFIELGEEKFYIQDDYFTIEVDSDKVFVIPSRPHITEYYIKSAIGSIKIN